VLARAPLAWESRHAVLEHAGRQELPELAPDELRQARAVAGLRTARRKASRCSAMTWWSTVCAVSRGR
jgi:hypothetical protein